MASFRFTNYEAQQYAKAWEEVCRYLVMWKNDEMSSELVVQKLFEIKAVYGDASISPPRGTIPNE